MFPRFPSLVVCSVAVLALAATASASPIQWRVEDGGNGHFYNVIGVSKGISWTDANDAAVARGSGWHLVTITSAEENAFVYGLVAGKPQFWSCCSDGNAQGPWLGATKAGAGAFQWVTGEAFGYTNWAAGQPSGIGDRITLFAANAPDAPTWGNLGGNSEAVLGYVIETEQAESLVAVIEEPSCQGSAGVSNIRGFAFSTINGISLDRVVEVTFDRGTKQRSTGDLACCSSRGDVHAAFPVAPVRSGFSGIFNWCLLTPGKHTITLRFESPTGQTLTLTRDFLSYCEHPADPFLQAGEFDWASPSGSCEAGAGGTLVCAAKPEVCEGQLRYEWTQASQGLVLRSGCVADAANPPPPPACSDTVISEVGTSD
jgi:hypothetical protein